LGWWKRDFGMCEALLKNLKLRLARATVQYNKLPLATLAQCLLFATEIGYLQGDINFMELNCIYCK
jgi:hypothetical protein